MWFFAALVARAEVVTYPAPAEENLLSSDYTVEVGGKAVPVYRIVTQWQDGKYSMATFDFSGPVTVKIKTNRPLGNLTVLPAKYGIKPTIENGEAVFTTDRPFKISFEPTGYDSPLLIFGNALEQDPPKPDDPNLIYFGAGVHRPEGGVIRLAAGQTLYLAGGAVVKAAVSARGDNIRILGRGMLDGGDWEHRLGPSGRMLNPTNCKNLLVQDIIIRDSFHWTLVPQDCDGVRIENVKIVGSKNGNDDGINPCNSSNVVIRDCFIRTDDDCIAIKGLGRRGMGRGFGAPGTGSVPAPAVPTEPQKASENIEIADCIFWTDYANVFRIGSESRTEIFRNIHIHDCDVIHSLRDRHYKEYWMKTVFYLQPSNNTPMENIRFENIRINGEGRENLIKIMPMPLPMTATNPGKHIKNVLFKNIEVYGTTTGSLGSIYVAGVDADHVVQDITFDRVVRYGNLLTANSTDLEIGPFATDIKFLGGVGSAVRELHVAKTGSDTNAGDAAKPFLTISRAAQEAQPGDTVVIHGGTYREKITLPRGGTAENARIVYLAAPGERVVVKGSEPLTSWHSEGGGVWRAEVPEALFGDFNPFATLVSGPQFAGDAWRHLGEVYLDGVAYAEQPTREAVTSGGADTWFAQKEGDLTRIWANFGTADPNRALAEINVRPHAFAPAKPGVNYLTIDRIAIGQTANNWASLDNQQPGAISSGGGIHWIIQNCAISDAKCVAISLAQPNRDLTRSGPNRPAFGEFEDLTAVGHHLVRNNLIQRCGQAGIFSLLHGTKSEFYGNQIEDINALGQFAGDEVGGIRLAVAVDTIIRDNLIRRVRGAQAGYGIVLGPLYQGVRITGNVIMETEGSPLYFQRSHGPVLVDNNVIVGPGAATGEGVKLRSAEASVLALNLFADCAFTDENAGQRGAPGTISYRPHSLVTKQTIPALALDNKWFANIFLRGGLDKLPKNHGCEVDYNAYMAGAAKSAWADEHSAVVVEDGGFALAATPTTVRVTFDLNARPKVSAPKITASLIGRFALTQSIERPDGRPVSLVTDFFGNSANHSTGVVGPFAWYQIRNGTSALLFERRARANISSPEP